MFCCSLLEAEVLRSEVASLLALKAEAVRSEVASCSLLESELSALAPKIIKKSSKNRSWKALGGLLGALGGQDGPLRLKNAAMRSRPAT